MRAVTIVDSAGPEGAVCERNHRTHPRRSLLTAFGSGIRTIMC